MTADDDVLNQLDELVLVTKEAKKDESDETGTALPSLKQLFMDALVLFEKSPEKSYESWCQIIEQCHRQHLFSLNETRDDLHSADMRYLTADAYAGQSQLQSHSMQPHERCLQLLCACQHFLTFMTLAYQYGFTTQDPLSLESITPFHWRSWLRQSQSTLSHISSDSRHIPAAIRFPKQDVAQSRHEKVERFKREKALKEQIRLYETVTMQNTNNKRIVEDDEEPERAYVEAFVELHVLQTENNWKMALQELDLLYQRLISTGQETYQRQNPVSTVRPVQEPFVLLPSSRDPTSQRQAVLNQVFQPGYRLPTMTIDEYLQQEAQRGNILQGGNGPRTSSEAYEMDREERALVEANFDRGDDRVEEEERIKKLAQDLLREKQPRGWGNRMNRS